MDKLRGFRRWRVVWVTCEMVYITISPICILFNLNNTPEGKTTKEGSGKCQIFRNRKLSIYRIYCQNVFLVESSEKRPC